MEKLLQTQTTKKGGQYASTLSTQRTKKIFSCGGYDFFANTQVTLKMSTLFRMNYICKPIAGLLINTVNFFQDGSVRYHLMFGLKNINEL
jgi:hypothetical protein